MVHLLEADLDRKKASVDELEGKLQGMANFVELVSKELDHLASIFHVCAGGLIYEYFIIIFKRQKGCTFNHFYSEKSSKRAK